MNSKEIEQACYEKLEAANITDATIDVKSSETCLSVTVGFPITYKEHGSDGKKRYTIMEHNTCCIQGRKITSQDEQTCISSTTRMAEELTKMSKQWER